MYTHYTCIHTYAYASYIYLNGISPIYKSMWPLLVTMENAKQINGKTNYNGKNKLKNIPKKT